MAIAIAGTIAIAAIGLSTQCSARNPRKLRAVRDDRGVYRDQRDRSGLLSVGSNAVREPRAERLTKNVAMSAATRVKDRRDHAGHDQRRDERRSERREQRSDGTAERSVRAAAARAAAQRREQAQQRREATSERTRPAPQAAARPERQQARPEPRQERKAKPRRSPARVIRDRRQRGVDED